MTDFSGTIAGLDPKPWWQSRTIIGAGVSMIATIASVAGFGLPADVQGQAVDLLLLGGNLAGGALTFWGRLKATQPIR